MPVRNLVAVGASAGGVEALQTLVQRLPLDVPAGICVTLHISPVGRSLLPDILSRAGPLPAAHAADGDPIAEGCIYVAPPDRHLIIGRDRLSLSAGPRENGHRPAVDPMLRSAGESYGERAIGVVLSGSLDDGSAGLRDLKTRGGLTVVQDPDDALYPGMPANAIQAGAPDHVAPLNELAGLIARLADMSPVTRGPAANDKPEVRMASVQDPPEAGAVRPSPFSCPECSGVLWESGDGEPSRYRCRVGHAFSFDSLLAQQSSALEDALWAALRALEEKAALEHRMARRADSQSQLLSAGRFETQASEDDVRAALLRQLLQQRRDAAASGSDGPW